MGQVFSCEWGDPNAPPGPGLMTEALPVPGLRRNQASRLADEILYSEGASKSAEGRELPLLACGPIRPVSAVPAAQ